MGSTFHYNNIIFPVPGIPRNIILNPLSPTNLTVTWEDPTTLNGVLVGFVLQLSVSMPVSWVSTVRVPSTTHSFTWNSLHPHYSYEVSIVALTEAGRGPSSSSMIQMPEDGKCIIFQVLYCEMKYLYSLHNLQLPLVHQQMSELSINLQKQSLSIGKLPGLKIKMVTL